MFGHVTLDPTFFGYPASTLPWTWMLFQTWSLSLLAGTCIYLGKKKGPREGWRAAIPMFGGWLFGELLHWVF